MRRPTIAPPTLEQMRRSAPWLRLWCAGFGCRHHSAMALTPLIIRWGPHASSDVLRRRARCTACGHRGATLQLPSWVNLETGCAPFPVNETAPIVSFIRRR
jgi:hypothetical protein